MSVLCAAALTAAAICAIYLAAWLLGTALAWAGRRIYPEDQHHD